MPSRVGFRAFALALHRRLRLDGALFFRIFGGRTVEYIVGAVGLVAAWYYHDYKIGFAALFGCLLLLSLKRLTEKVNDLVSIKRTEIEQADING
jgi:hypothetical protein